MNVIEFYNLSAEMRAILADLESSGGELIPEVEARLQALGETTDAKVAEMALACRELDRSDSAVEAEEFRLRDRKRAIRAVKCRIREAIQDHMTQTGTPRVRTDLVTVSLVEGDAKVVWDGKEDRIPDEYRITLVEHRINRERVLQDIADGVPLPEGVRVKKQSHIRIT